MARDKRLPVGAVMLAQNDSAFIYRFGDQVVVESVFAGRRVETRLPANLEWLWTWSQILQDGCNQLARLEQ